MLKITITVEDENLEYKATVETASFDFAEEKFDQIQRNYEKRVAMELKGKIPF